MLIASRIDAHALVHINRAPFGSTSKELRSAFNPRFKFHGNSESWYFLFVLVQLPISPLKTIPYTDLEPPEYRLSHPTTNLVSSRVEPQLENRIALHSFGSSHLNTPLERVSACGLDSASVHLQPRSDLRHSYAIPSQSKLPVSLCEADPGREACHSGWQPVESALCAHRFASPLPTPERTRVPPLQKDTQARYTRKSTLYSPTSPPNLPCTPSHRPKQCLPTRNSPTMSFPAVFPRSRRRNAPWVSALL